ncbi:hypothetical protein AGABI2DRAFT_181426 [Agaricus bisporus var. bisporus H97]|uniref:hypothetical protein n=1 Tax=Agaricus bisporus var. bisporus (strain H97 / ATCC MYA-4626 / FGSC 10389) TaxID=936046 RepID=UPI00029F624B|nr:hypothetical protein AGABI2DRAFT_181426 [Agaricus bisporus var. bisporus H97]EKV42212.1 hypothetical protein AGABI2DRAFT_181426 [Agaricus bisporus var. bisporus H97]
MKLEFIVSLAFATLPVALGHGRVLSPPSRVIGDANLEACGAGVYDVLDDDATAPIENAAAKVGSDYNDLQCHLWFCKGYQFEDNEDRVQRYSTGQVVNFAVDIVARHTGIANVSVVDLASQTTIGKPLFNWPVYTNNSLGPPNWPKNETNFDVTIPSGLDAICDAPNKCAIQWWWNSVYSNHQTFESCVDFVIV